MKPLLNSRIEELSVSVMKTLAMLKLAQTPRAKRMHRTKLIEMRLQLKTNKELLKRMNG